MTTWQDEPPTSRRALRERERAENQVPVETASAAPPSFRVRDYSPEARGAQFSTVGNLNGAPTARHTQPSAPPVQQPPVQHEVVERTLTRREMRALREAAEQAANPVGDAPGATPLPPVAEAAPPELVDPMAELADWQRQAVPPAPPQFAQPVPDAAPQQYSQAAPPVPQFAVAPETQAPQGWAREPEPAPDVVVVPAASYAPPAPEFELPADAPESFARPEGHWSRQADIDDRTQVDDILPSRDLSRSDAITTSALVLPSMPDYPLGPLSSTGEILVTGSINLPRMLGATGVHPARFDHSEVDSIIDASDREDSHPNSSPVRAIRAVSTHTSTQGIVASKRPRSKLPTYLLAGTATVMGAGVLVLFIGGMLLDVF